MRQIYKAEKTIRATQQQNDLQVPAECYKHDEKKALLEKLQKGEEATFEHSF